VAILKYNAKPSPAASADNVRYILRAGACATFDCQNITGIQTPADAIAYANARAFEEELAPRRGAGTARNHHRMILTFPDERNPERALAVAKDFLRKEFPEAKAIISIHTDVKNIHCHVWLDARLINGKKLDLGTKYRQLDKLFARHYDNAYGTNHANEYAAQRQANRAAHHKKNPDWRALKSNEQQRTYGRKRSIESTSRTVAAAIRIESIARLDSIDRMLESPSRQALDGLGTGSERDTRNTHPERSRTKPRTTTPVHNRSQSNRTR
jgi:hypothetical protein